MWQYLSLAGQLATSRGHLREGVNGIVVAQQLGTYPNRSRKAVCQGWTFMQQNTDKQSEYAKRALQGQKLTWVMPPMGKKAIPN